MLLASNQCTQNQLYNSQCNALRLLLFVNEHWYFYGIHSVGHLNFNCTHLHLLDMLVYHFNLKEFKTFTEKIALFC